MTRTISFMGDYPWPIQPGGRRNRPYSEIVLTGRSGYPDQRILCVVDSGADHTVLDEGWLLAAGYSSGDVVCSSTARVASGAIMTLDVYGGVDVEIEGNPVTLARVQAAAGAADLLGRSGFLTAMHVGFDSSGWLYT